MSAEDLTGRSRLVRNVGASYASHFVFVAFGFIMPRLIDGYIGQAALGVWDFGWAFVSYLSLAMLGIGSSVNRFVATYRATGDVNSLNRMISTVIVVQLGIAALVAAAALILAWLIPNLLEHRLGDYAGTARWIIACLGGALAIEMAFDAWRGVISGCHRWDYYNAINAGGHAVSSALMILALTLGGGLREMALVYLCATAGIEILRYVIARRVCPELRVRFAWSNREDAEMVVKFGVKTIMLGLPAIITFQTVNVFIVAHLGPAALAVMARPMALVRHITTLTSKFGYVLTPTAGSLQSQQKKTELREFALESARVGWIMAIPPLTFMFVLGDLVIGIWMGPDYANWLVCAVLSAGALLSTSQHALLRIMIGLDGHGIIAKKAIFRAAAVLGVGITSLYVFGWTLPRAAMLIATTSTLSLGLTVIIEGVRYMNLGADYLPRVLWPAVRLLTAIGGALAALRFASPYGPLITLGAGAAITGVLTLILQRRDVARVLVAVRA